MKRILDSDFRYRPSFATDLRKTFARARREQHADRHAKAEQDAAVIVGTIARAARSTAP